MAARCETVLSSRQTRLLALTFFLLFLARLANAGETPPPAGLAPAGTAGTASAHAARAASAPADNAHPDTIPAGSVITYKNWQQYSRFMPLGMRTLFAGDHFWRMPAGIQIEVGPTVAIPLPQRYLADTARHAGQVKLTQLPQGGYVPTGYVAGIPFPEAERDPALAPYELFYDAYYHYAPRLQQMISCNYTGDAYGNFTQTEIADSVYSQLAYLSDAGFPRTLPDSNGYYLVKYYQQLAPEQGKYTTSLDISYADVTRLDDIYTYLPSARRPLRLSEASRCSPFPGNDFTWDESNYGPPSLPQDFKITYVGSRQILFLVHLNQQVFKSCGGATGPSAGFFYPGGKGVVPWPQPTLGKWELREVYVIEMSRLPAYASGYCYSRRVLYVDKETLFPLAIDLYDPAGELYKTWLEFQSPMRVPDTGAALGVNGANELLIANFKDKHLTMSTAEHPCFNSDCRPQYLDVSRYASPDGLSEIAQ
jgi:hypothetical protein